MTSKSPISWVPIPKYMHTSQCINVKLSTRLSDANKKPGGNEVATSSQPPPPPERPQSRIPGGPKGVPTALDKKYLVWSGSYKSASDIPKQLDGDVIHRARSWGRIRMNIGFLILTAVGAGFMVYLGKQAVARGESVEKQNLEWHRKLKEEHERGKK